jgi:tetratricopeptide (TPR) repeat protein
MRAIFDQSWSLLTGAEQTVFRRLSVFRGGFTRAAVEAVCGETPWTDDDLYLAENAELQLTRRQFEVLNALAGLADKSFLRQTASGRFEIHELMRQYGEAKLAEAAAEEQQTRHRYAQYYLTLLAQQGARMKGRSQRAAHEIVAQELENIKVGWQWAAAHGRTDLLIRSVEALWLFHVERNLFGEAENILSRTIAMLESPVILDDRQMAPSELVLAVLLIVRAAFLMRLGNYPDALRLFDRGLELLYSLEAQRWIALALNFKGETHRLLGAYEEARRCLMESIKLSQQAGDLWLTAYSLNDLGLVTHWLDDTAEAQKLSQQSLAIFVEIDDRRGMAFVFNNLGLFAYQLVDYAEADWLYRESLALRRANRDQWGTANLLICLGLVAQARGDHESAYRNLLEAIQTAMEVRALPVLLDALVELVTLLVKAGETDQAADILTVSLHHPALSKQTQERAKKLLATLHGVADPQPVALLPEEEADRDLKVLVTKLLEEQQPVQVPGSDSVLFEQDKSAGVME